MTAQRAEYLSYQGVDCEKFHPQNIGRNGFLAEPNNPKDFAMKVIAILENPALKEEMSRQARLYIQKFDWLVCMEKFENKLYQHVGVSKHLEVKTAGSVVSR